MFDRNFLRRFSVGNSFLIAFLFTTVDDGGAADKADDDATGASTDACASVGRADGAIWTDVGIGSATDDCASGSGGGDDADIPIGVGVDIDDGSGTGTGSGSGSEIEAEIDAGGGLIESPMFSSRDEGSMYSTCTSSSICGSFGESS